MPHTAHHARCTASSLLLLTVALVGYGGIGTAARAQSVDGYLSSYSAVLGGTVDLHVSTANPTYGVRIWRYGSNSHRVARIDNLVGHAYSVAPDAYTTGANWPVSTTLNIPSTWQPGLYDVYLTDTSGVQKQILLPVRPATPGSTSKILFLDNAPTRQAYTNWGGKSLYSFNSTDHIRAHQVSLKRPIAWGQSQKAVEFASWADTMGLPVEYASTFDLENDPSLLSNYNLVVTAGHDEYWSRNMRNAFDTFTHNGGNAVLLSGNMMWWQVRIEGDQMVCYKNPASNDPMYEIDNTLVTTNWYDNPVNDPENRSTGVSWRHGGYVNEFGFYPASEGNGGYTVADASHWLFDGTGVQDGDVIGQAETIVGYEADGALFTWVNGKPVVTGEDGTPLNYQILGYAPAGTPNWSGYATMGIFDIPGGGTIFNAATVDWADGLWNMATHSIADPTVSQITYNVINRLAAPVPEPMSLPLVGSAIGILACKRHQRRNPVTLA